MVWFTSDLHLGHNKPFLYEPRGFKNIQEHDNAIIENWNKIIRPNDKVYVLGDLMLNDNDLVMTTAYYAYANNMTLNRYYYARDIDKQIEKNLEVYVEELHNQKPEENCIYLFDEGTVKDYKDSGLHFYEISRWIFGTKDSIEGLTELKLS